MLISLVMVDQLVLQSSEVRVEVNLKSIDEFPFFRNFIIFEILNCLVQIFTIAFLIQTILK